MSAVLKPTGFPYNAVFSAIRATLRSACTISEEALNEALKDYNFSPNTRVIGTDNELYRKLVLVVFYSGFKAATVTAHKERILDHLGDFQTVAKYSAADVDAIAKDPKMLGHRGKINACVKNARRFVEILQTHNSVAHYFNTFGSFDEDENVQRFRDALIDQFAFLGEITVYHYMMELALNVAKPDRVLSRVFHRFGLVDDPQLERNKKQYRQYLWDTVKQAREFAAETGESIRLIDINIMAFGQQKIVEFGLKGTCLEKRPKCLACQAKKFCAYTGPAAN